MGIFSRFIGADGENQATLYLKKEHYKILERNYKTYYGEVDIIAKKGDLLVFVEVKK
ncbi:MAG: YraN family protein, partial [Clostridia bacterium]|nr:YraN family protein [Clostridia bacterium]